MSAGKNQLVRVIRYSYPQDDSIGGSVPSGTVIHDSVLVRIKPIRPTMALLEQGLETIKLFETSLSYVAKDVKETDELIVYEPVDSEYFNQSFRVISVRHPSLRPNDPRSDLSVVIRRREEAHGLQL